MGPRRPDLGLMTRVLAAATGPAVMLAACIPTRGSRVRTIVHGLLTTILALGYAAVAVFLASFLSIVGGASGLAVAISTELASCRWAGPRYASKRWLLGLLQVG